MQLALDQFHISIRRVRDLIALQSSVQSQSTNALDVSDMLRAALVLAVSALDFYVHEVVTLGMLEIHRRQRPEPTSLRNTTQSSFSRLRVPLGGVQQDRLAAIDIASWLEVEIQQTQGHEFLQKEHTVSSLIPVISKAIESKLNSFSWLESEIREQLGYQSFQQSDRIANAIKYISDKNLWEEVSTLMNRPAKDIKQRLSSIVDRRNKIAHEADIDPTFNIGERWRIDEPLANDAVNFIEELVEAIHLVLQITA